MADTHRDLTTYLAQAARSARDKFAAANPHPFLVRIPDAAAADADPWADDFSFATRVSGLNDDEEDDRPEHATIIAPVTKREGGPFPDLIGIGRARNCDVVLRFASVSKLHAQLRRDGTSWSLIDLESVNGTFLDGEQVKPRVATPVGFGSRLRFGTVEVELLDAPTLFDRLRARIGR